MKSEVLSFIRKMRIQALEKKLKIISETFAKIQKEGGKIPQQLEATKQKIEKELEDLKK